MMAVVPSKRQCAGLLAAALSTCLSATACGLAFPTLLAENAGAGDASTQTGTLPDGGVDSPSGSGSGSGGGSSGSSGAGGSGSSGGAGSSGSSSGAGSSGSSSGGADAGMVPPSCRPGGAGMTDCNGGSCCASPLLPGGTYFRAYTNSGDGGTATDNSANVSPFRLDLYEVTVGRFRQFVGAALPPDGGAGWVPPAGSGKHTHLNSGLGLLNAGSTGGHEPGWATTDDVNVAPTSTNLACGGYATWTNAPGVNEDKPINCENWYEAYAFCIWDGGFLPSEAEWEFAAAGGSQLREYPWGSAAPGTMTQYADYNCYYPSGTSNCNNVSTIAPVGTATLGAGLWGQLDMAGGMLEWAIDVYQSAYSIPCPDCAYVDPGTYRVFRGGMFAGTAAEMHPAYRVMPTVTSASRNYYSGFRCARSP